MINSSHSSFTFFLLATTSGNSKGDSKDEDHKIKGLIV